jgi:hypothetical protein
MIDYQEYDFYGLWVSKLQTNGLLLPLEFFVMGISRKQTG